MVSADTGVGADARADSANTIDSSAIDSSAIDSSAIDSSVGEDAAVDSSTVDSGSPADVSATDAPQRDVVNVPDVANMPDGSVLDCPGRPSGCVSGTPGGICGDAILAPMCVAGSWTCPRGTIPITECGCVGRPPGPDCTCVARMWMCPMPDAGARTFACGTTACSSGAQYCLVTLPGVPGAMPSYSCQTLPRGCAPTPSCRCIPDTGGGRCMQSSAGDITVTIATP